MATSKKQYVLYLDESQTHKYNKIKHKKENFHFCMAGVIIAVDDYESVENSVKDLKRNIWSEFPDPERIILHQMSVTDAEKGRLDVTKHPEYAKFNRRCERRKLYNELKNVFANNNMTIVGSCVNEDVLKQYYSLEGKNKQDVSLVTMQLLLENYCHFLCANNGIGSIIYEYRELIENERLRDRYYHMKLMGTMYMNKAAAEKRLLGIDFVNKSENCVGLQIADFVPLSFARDHGGKEQGNPNIFGTLKYHRYDGGIGMKDRFGIKYMP